MNQQRTKHRITRHLQSIADGATVPESSPEAARRRAHQRVVNRRRGVVAGLAAASVAGVVAGISVLSTPASTKLQTSDEVSAPRVDSDDAVPETTPPNAVTVPAPVPGAAAAIQRDATAADPAFVWKVVEPDKDSSVNGTFSGSGVTTFPTLVVSTAPGRSNDYDNIETVVWQTTDGIEFTRSDLTSPFPADYWQPQFVGDDVFSVGTAPGIAVSDPNPLQIAVNAVDGTDADWRSVDLPIDANEFLDVPMTYGNLEVARVELDDALLVAATPLLIVDYEAVASAQGLDPRTYSYWNEADRGIVYADADCVTRDNQIPGPFAPTTIVLPVDQTRTTVSTIVEPPAVAVVPVSEVPTVTDPAAAGENGAAEECPTKYISWEDAGVPAATIAALDSTATRFFTVDADLNVTEIESPQPGTDFVPFAFGQDGRFFDRNSSAARYGYETGDLTPYYEFDGSGFVQGEMASVNWANSAAAFGDGLAGLSYSSDGTRFTLLDAANAVTEVNLGPVLGENTFVGDSSQTSAMTSDGRLVSVVSEYFDPIAAAGGVEVTFDGVTLRRERANADWVFFDAATGEPIPADRIVSDDKGRSILAADGSVIPEFSQEGTYSDLESHLFTGEEAGHFSVLTTADGAAFSVESIADLLGLDDAEISGVPRVVSDGTTVTVTVTLNERYDDDTRKQLVLVGTPIG